MREKEKIIKDVYANIDILVMSDFSVLLKYIEKYLLPENTHLVIFSSGISYSKK